MRSVGHFCGLLLFFLVEPVLCQNAAAAASSSYCSSVHRRSFKHVENSSVTISDWQFLASDRDFCHFSVSSAYLSQGGEWPKHHLDLWELSIYGDLVPSITSIHLFDSKDNKELYCWPVSSSTGIEKLQVEWEQLGPSMDRRGYLIAADVSGMGIGRSIEKTLNLTVPLEYLAFYKEKIARAIEASEQPVRQTEQVLWYSSDFECAESRNYWTKTQCILSNVSVLDANMGLFGLTGYPQDVLDTSIDRLPNSDDLIYFYREFKMLLLQNPVRCDHIFTGNYGVVSMQGFATTPEAMALAIWDYYTEHKEHTKIFVLTQNVSDFALGMYQQYFEALFPFPLIPFVDAIPPDTRTCFENIHWLFPPPSSFETSRLPNSLLQILSPEALTSRKQRNIPCEFTKKMSIDSNRLFPTIGMHAEHSCLDSCIWKFKEYQPSPFEIQWLENIDEWQFKVCEKVNETFDQMLEWLRGAQYLTYNVTAIFDPTAVSGEIFSRFIHTVTCVSQDQVYTKEVSSWIEPLVGITRHPFAACRDDSMRVIMTKEALVPMARHPLYGHSPGSKSMYFDAGMGMYDSGSQSWIRSIYPPRGIHWNRFVGWEITSNQRCSQVYDEIPSDLHLIHSFNNVAVSPIPHDLNNPLTHIQQLCTKDDICVFKLDIDTPWIETIISADILAVSELAELIDEFYFEHHVNLDPMNKWWGLENSAIFLNATYETFFSMRNMGIRAHSWP